MIIDIQSQNFALTDAIRGHAERRLRFALTCCNDSIQRVIIRLSDINGPRGGSDKRCHLYVVMDGLPDVVVKDTQPDLYVAIDRAANRVGRSVVRRMARMKEQKRLDRRWFSDNFAIV